MSMPFGTKIKLAKRKENMERGRITIHCSWPECQSSISVYRSQGVWGTGRKHKGTYTKHAYCPSCKDRLVSITGKSFRMNGFGRLFAKLAERRTARIGNSESLRAFLLVRQDGRCLMCKKSLQLDRHPKQWQVDHVKPVGIGGTSAIENLQALCTECHQQKTNSELSLVRPYCGPTTSIKHWMTHYQKDQIISELRAENARLHTALARHVEQEEMAG